MDVERFVRERRGRWSRFEALLQATERLPDREMGVGRLLELVRLYRQTCSDLNEARSGTANAALLALGLYARGAPPWYLTWAKMAYDWTQRCLGRPDGLVRDHIDLSGRIEPSTWSYNQGAMIAAAVRLFRATGAKRYLTDATRTADAALREFRDPLGSGEPPFFLAIFYRDLLELGRVVPSRDDRAAMQAFADEAWAKSRNPESGLFRFGGRRPTLLDQAAMVQIYALLAA